MNREFLIQLYWKKHQSTLVKDNGSFQRFYTRFLSVIEDSISKICKDIQEPIPELSTELKNALLAQLQRISLRTLILEMKVCERCQELEGETGEEKYRCYADHLLQSEDYLRQLYQDYPVMYECLMQAVCRRVNSLEEAIQRFAADRTELNRIFFADRPARRIQKISGGESDRHNEGRQVYVLELDNEEKLVYKPRCLRAETAWAGILRWISQNIGIPYWWNRIWDRGGYGWCEWVEAKTCETYEQLENYYRRNGILLCVCYLLGTRDLHYENLIAHGEYPVPVDLEMAAGGATGGEKLTAAERLYGDSVLQTGILPLYAWNEKGEGVNVGAIGGNGGQLVPLCLPVIVKAGSVDMKVEYRRPEMKEGKNLATWNGTFQEPYLFLDEIEEGFERAYRFLMKNRGEAKERLKAFQKAPIRYLFRDTQQYAMLLLTSYGPDFLSSRESRENILSEITYREPGHSYREPEWHIRQEIKALRIDDIPYFWYDIWQRDLHNVTGEVQKGYFRVPVIESVKKRLRQMSEAGMRQQQRWIRAALSMGRKTLPDTTAEKERQNRRAVAEREWEDAGMTRERIGREVAKRIGDLLLEDAIWSESRQDVSWISMVMAGYGERRYWIHPMGLYLYDGIAGMTLFLAALAKETGNETYREAARVLTGKLFEHTRQLEISGEGQRLPTGAYSGEASVAYTYLLLYSVWQQDILLDYVYRQCRVLAGMLPFDTLYDVLGGNAGAVLVLLLAYEKTGKREYLVWAKEAGEYLIQSGIRYEWGLGWAGSAAKTALTGFAHGAGGIMLALARLGYAAKEEKFLRAAREAYAFEQYYYDAERRDWKDLRFAEEEVREKTVQEKRNVISWCHGRGGILAARKRAAGYAAGDFREEWEKDRYETDLAWEDDDRLENEGYCLCHGRCGGAALLACMGKKEAAARE